MIEIYFNGNSDPLNSDNYIGFSYSKPIFEDSFYLGSTSSVQASLVIPKDALPSNLQTVKIKLDGNDYLDLIVDNIEISDNEEATITLTDRLVNLNVNYDISESVPISAINLLNKICTDFNLPHDTFDFVNKSVEISSYDNTITARDYLSMIGELAGGYFEINNQGKLEIKYYSNLNISNEITADDIDSYKLGESVVIQRVVYEFGAIKKQSSSDESLNTLYLNPDNMFLQNITDNQFTALCNNILGFTFYNVEIPNCNKFYKNGNYLNLIGLDNEEYTILNQFSTDYFGGFVGSYKSDIKNSKQEITKILSPSQKIKRLGIEVDQANNRITQWATKTEQIEGSIDILNPIIDTNVIIISSDDNKKPYETKTYEIDYSCELYGNPINVDPQTNDSHTGITYQIDADHNKIKFSVNNTTIIPETENRYTFTWTYNGLTTQRVIVLSLSTTPQSIVMSASAPSDTSLIWYDTTEESLKSYVNGSWQTIDDFSDDITKLQQGVNNNNQAILGEKKYKETEDDEFLTDKDYYQLVNNEYVLYTGDRSGDPSSLNLYEAYYVGGLNNQYKDLEKQLQNKISSQEAESLTERITTRVIQEEAYTKTQIQQIIDGTGYDGQKVSAVISTEATFDKNGMTYEKTGADTSSNINQNGLKIEKLTRDAGGNISEREETLFAGYVIDNRFGNTYVNDTVVYTHNLISSGYTDVGGHGRFQQFLGEDNESGVGFFDI